MGTLNRLTLYRRHIKACAKTKPTYFPATPKDRKLDDCQCPIVCSGYLEHVDGRILHYSLGTTDWIEANDRTALMILSGRKPEAQDDSKPNADAITIQYAVKEYLDSRTGLNLTNERTAAGYKQFFDERLLPWCESNGVRLLSELNLFRLQTFLGTIDLKHTTRTKFISVLRAFYAYCITHTWTAYNVAKGLKIGSAVDGEDEGESGEKIGLELHEYKAVLSTLDSYPADLDTMRLRAIVELMRWTGMRISDAEKFCRGELVCAASTGCNANFIQFKLRHLKNGRGRCIVSVPDHVVKQLNALPYNSEAGGKKFFFRVPGLIEGRRHWYIKITKLFADARATYGEFLHEGRTKHVTPHSLRHTYAILALNAGADIRDVSKNLGHLKVSTTIAHYSHDTDASKRDREDRNRKLIAAQMV